MAKPSEVLAALQDQLQAASGLSWVDDTHIYLGVNDEIDNYPAIVIEYAGTGESDDRYGKQDLALRAMVFGFIKVFDADKGIVGDDNIKGIADMENDIKKAISADPTIGGYAYHTKFIGYTDPEYVNYPERSIGILIEIQFEQVSTLRT